MSQALHRQRLRDRQGPVAADSSFLPAGNVATFAAGRPSLPPRPTTVDTTEVAPAAVIAKGNGSAVEAAAGEPVQVLQPTSQQQPAVLKPGEQPADTMAGDQKKIQARATAQTLAGLATEQYTEALRDLQINQPEIYPEVVDELNRMVSDRVDEEGDGFDLSGITDPLNADA